MQRKIITTADGSNTIHLVEWDEHYHSIHGAIQEANHVFIKHGLLFFIETSDKPLVTSNLSANSEISILEIGFGTGLNAFLTLIEAEKLKVKVNYVGVEAFPITSEELAAMNYPEQLENTKIHEFEKMHQMPWDKNEEITTDFRLTKLRKDFRSVNDENEFDLIYFDAFGARVQPGLWTDEVFQKMYDALQPNGVLVTYSAKGSVRRAMIAAGFQVEKLPGPPGKREMLRARKGSQHSA